MEIEKLSRKAWALGLVFVFFTYFSILKSLLFDPQYVGPFDWQLFAALLEASRKVIQDFGQFPWWNPYSGGGYPHFASSITYGAFSLPAILSLIIGPLAALKLSVLSHAVFGFFGMYLLAKHITKNSLYRAVAGVIFACNGGIVIHLAVGHLFWDYFIYPWILYCILELNKETLTRRAIKLTLSAGILMGLIVQSFLHYGFVYVGVSILFLFGINLWQIRKQRELVFTQCTLYVLMVFAFLAVGGFRLYLCSVVSRDYPRIERWEIETGVIRFLRIFLRPGQTILTSGGDPLGWWEWGCYVGLLASGLFLYSLKKKIRYYHWFVLIGVMLFFSTTRPWPYFWLSSYLPVFKSMRVAARIRIWLIPFFTFGVVSALQSIGSKRKKLATSLSLLLMLDISSNAFYALYQAFQDRSESHESDTWAKNDKPYPLMFHDVVSSSLFQTLKQNYTHTPGYEPVVAPPLRSKPPEQLPLKGVNDSNYRGEFYTAAGPVEPVFWTPNRILFEKIQGPLHLNMNLGSYWYVNGEPKLQHLKVVEFEKAIELMPDSQGRIELTLVPKGYKTAMLLSVMGFLMTLSLSAFLLRNANRFRKS